jgi:hypothetical protein
MDFSDFSIGGLFLSFAWGVFGVYLIKEARRKGHPIFGVIGIVLIVFPYFISDVLYSLVLGVGLLALAYRLRN